ncbi:UNVERIFIED_CONTAM: hypothetical protein FKN15_019951 [Acipenser sinensis]
MISANVWNNRDLGKYVARPENLTLSVPTVLEAGNQTTITCSVHNVYPSESASMQFESGGIEGTSKQQTQENGDGTGTIKEGDSMVLWCGADSNPGVSRYSWFKQTTESSSWVVVNGSAAAELRIPLASRTDCGHYRCIAENADGDGEASRATSLDVQYGPRNVSVSVTPSGTIKEGDSVVLWCGGDANPGVSRYSWFKQPAESSSWAGVNGSAAAELRIPLASRTDSGHYRCIAENADGDGEASRATSLLSVPTVLEAGNQTTITCSVHNVYPSESASMQFESGGIEGTSKQQTQENGDGTCVKTVTFTFIPQHFHNRKNLSCSVAHPNLTHTLQANVTLDIKSAELRIPLASRTDSGHYRCIAENADGDGEASRATSLDVQYPPDLVRVRPCDNRSLCWVCEVEANPLANLTWLEDGAAGRRLMSGGELLHNGTRTSLRIQMAQQKEVLICAAVNSHGQKQEVKTINKKGGTALNTILPAAVGILAAFITVVTLFCIVRRKGRETRQRDSSAEASPEVIYDVVQNLTEDQEPAAKASDEEEELVYADLDLAPRGKRNWEPVSESELTEYSDLKTVAQLKAGDTAASQQ